MIALSRYSVSDASAGIESGILKNKLGLKNQSELTEAEDLLLLDTYKHFSKKLKNGEVALNLSLFFEIHKHFLGTLYDFAGKVRTINVSKDGVMFAPAAYLDKALAELKMIVEVNQPGEKETKAQIVKKLAVIHNEFNFVHPFREGNGRTIRLFLDLIGMSLGYEPICQDVVSKTAYIQACNAGLAQNHKPMEAIIYKGLKKL